MTRTHDLSLHSKTATEVPSQPPRWEGSENKPNVLLASVFGPYARNDEYGSRKINPMELWHNQVTRVQGAFSLRMFHRSWGLMLIQANIQAPCTCLDFPTRDRFIEELKTHSYDVIGISAIIPNVGKVKEMRRLIREHQPHAVVVLGGHISNMPEVAERTGVDHVAKGDGVRWFREYLGEDTDQPIRHPRIWSGLNKRCLGVDLGFDPKTAAAALIPSVGCPVGCNFCSTSAMFGGKGHCVDFYASAEELFEVMCGLADTMGIQSFFVMDENFLLRRKRAMGLLELMKKHDRAWGLYVFSSASALKQYTFEELAELGVSWVWMGLEGKDSRYHKHKLRDTDTHRFVRQLQDHGIRVLGSSIIGLEEHTPENIDEAIDYAVSHDTDFHQFMLYTPVPGTPLHAELDAQGMMLSDEDIDPADVHGQYRFNYRHPHLAPGDETDYLLRAFEKDFQVNGPSTVRMVETLLKGHRRYKNHPDKRIVRRFAIETDYMWAIPAATVWATRKWFKDNPDVRARMDRLLGELYAEFGLKARLTAPLIGRFIYNRIAREDKRLRAGKTYEPPTFYERNFDSPDAATIPAPIEAAAVGQAARTV